MTDSEAEAKAKAGRDQLTLRQISKDMQALSMKMDQVFDLVETVVQEHSPCNEKKKANENIDQIVKLIEGSPLTKHPMFADMMKPLKDMMQTQRA